MSEQERLMRRISALDFAAFELHMFLDTHPNNKEMLAKLDEYKMNADQLRSEYEDKYGPLSHKGDSENQWSWISDPWPWENEMEGEQ